jgi:DNA polymerase III delta subunit
MILFFGGDNDFEINRQITRLRAQYAKKHRDSLDEMLVDATVDGYAAVEQALLALPMFFSHRLVIVSSLSGLKNNMDEVAKLLDKVPDSTVAVFDGRGMDKRIRLYKLMSGLDRAKLFNKLNSSELNRWVQAEAKRHNAEIKPDSAQYLINRVGADQWLLSNELAKLANATSQITQAIIDEHTTRNMFDSVFDLIAAVSHSESSKAVKIYEQLAANGANEQQILSTLMWHYRVLALALTRADDETLSACGVKPYSIAKISYLAKDCSIDDVKRAYQAMLSADIAIKNGYKKPHQTMIDLIIELSEITS